MAGKVGVGLATGLRLNFKMLKTVLLWLGVIGTIAWGWRKMREHPPGSVRLFYWIAFLFLLHMAASH